MNSFQELLAVIQAADKIIIHRHQNPDPDALGSQLGLALSIQAAFPQKTVLMAGADVGDLAWIAQMDAVTEADYQNALVIVVDTANQPRISGKHYKQGAQLMKIDHHPNVEPYGNWQYVDPNASSCAEIIGDLINTNPAVLKMNRAVAQALYTGIVGDTGRFMYPSTSAHTLELAAQLICYDFQPHKINERLNQLSLSQARLQGYMFEHLTIDPSGAAQLIVPLDLLTKLGLDQSQAHAIVSTPGRLQEVHSWFIAVEKPDHTYRIHLRSQEPEIDGLAAQHAGGGHALASGANAQNLAEVVDIFQELIVLQKKFSAR